MVLSSLATLHRERLSENVTGVTRQRALLPAAGSDVVVVVEGKNWDGWKDDKYVTSQSLFTLDLYVHDDSISSTLFTFLPTATFVALTTRVGILAF